MNSLRLYAFLFVFFSACTSAPKTIPSETGTESIPITGTSNPTTVPKTKPLTSIYGYDVDEIRKHLTQDSPKKLSTIGTAWIAEAKRNLQEGIEVHAVEKIELEGLLSADSRYQKSTEVLKNLPTLYQYAFCARILSGIEAAQCLAKARQGIFRWMDKYQTVGNSINDSHLLLLFQSIDWILPFLSKKENLELKDWLQAFMDESDDYYSKLSTSTARWNNNWHTWRLVIRMMIAKLLETLLNANDEVEETESLINDHIKNNLEVPKNWKPSANCKNLENEPRYGSFDFRHRDALHYHVYNLKAWLYLGALDQNWLQEKNRETLKDTVTFIKPYVLKEKHHTEFVCSVISFDEQRRLAGQPDFQRVTWEPENAKTVLALAQVVFPEEKSWLDTLGSTSDDPFIQFLVEYKNAHPDSH